MKHLIIFVAIMMSLSLNLSADSISGIQNRIDLAFISLSKGNTSEYNKIEKELTDNEHLNNTYWLAYSKYYKSIYYIKNGQRDSSEIYNNESLKLLLSITNKTSEDYALLAIVQSFGIQFITSFIEIGIVSEKIDSWYKKAALC